MFNAENEDDKLQCPYDPLHSAIIRKHFQVHLLRCKKNHPEVEVLKCPFNIIHIIPESDYVNHLSACPDRKILTHYQGPVEDVENDIKHAPINDDEENWEDEPCDVPDFKPIFFSPKVKREQ